MVYFYFLFAQTCRFSSSVVSSPCHKKNKRRNILYFKRSSITASLTCSSFFLSDNNHTRPCCVPNLLVHCWVYYDVIVTLMCEFAHAAASKRSKIIRKRSGVFSDTFRPEPAGGSTRPWHWSLGWPTADAILTETYMCLLVKKLIST